MTWVKFSKRLQWDSRYSPDTRKESLHILHCMQHSEKGEGGGGKHNKMKNKVSITD